MHPFTHFLINFYISLEKHKDKKDLKVIACGGDGTAGWYVLLQSDT